jgi:hypothetical protein
MQNEAIGALKATPFLSLVTDAEGYEFVKSLANAIVLAKVCLLSPALLVLLLLELIIYQKKENESTAEEISQTCTTWFSESQKICLKGLEYIKEAEQLTQRTERQEVLAQSLEVCYVGFFLIGIKEFMKIIQYIAGDNPIYKQICDNYARVGYYLGIVHLSLECANVLEYEEDPGKATSVAIASTKPEGNMGVPPRLLFLPFLRCCLQKNVF